MSPRQEGGATALSNAESRPETNVPELWARVKGAEAVPLGAAYPSLSRLIAEGRSA